MPIKRSVECSARTGISQVAMSQTLAARPVGSVLSTGFKPTGFQPVVVECGSGTSIEV